MCEGYCSLGGERGEMLRGLLQVLPSCVEQVTGGGAACRPAVWRGGSQQLGMPRAMPGACGSTGRRKGPLPFHKMI